MFANMAIENHLIHYSTIHLSRREEILIHSIIALYSSKDGFKWISSDSDAAVVMIGSDIKNINTLGVDPFSDIKKEQVVCILGDMYYPKNARGVVHIDLPIKALQLVDKLSEIEKDYIQTEFSLNYIAVNQSTKKSSTKAINLHKIMPDAEPVESLLNRHGTIDFVPSKISKTLQESDQDENEGVITHLELFKTFDLQLESNPERQNEPKSFSLELVDSLNEEQVDSKKIINLNASQSASSDVSTKNTSTFFPVSDAVNLKEEIRLVPPTLTEVVSEMPEAIAKKIVNDLKLDDKAVHKNIEDNFASSEVPLSVDSNKTPKDNLSRTNNVLDSKSNAEETIDKKLTQQEEPEDEGLRIKLLRWPKADLIQQHPGNAILASMVINTPMSVQDMAKQSDLPISICQRFFDAVVSANVADYVDQVKPINQPTIEQPDEIEDIPQRKGIFYRIRAALGLVRK